MKAAIYVRVSTADQHVESQLYDLRELARQRNLEVAHEYRDEGISGARVRRPALDRMMADARQRSFEVVLVWASDRLARSTRHFLETLDELNRFGIEFVHECPQLIALARGQPLDLQKVGQQGRERPPAELFRHRP